MQQQETSEHDHSPALHSHHILVDCCYCETVAGMEGMDQVKAQQISGLLGAAAMQELCTFLFLYLFLLFQQLHILSMSSLYPSFFHPLCLLRTKFLQKNLNFLIP